MLGFPQLPAEDRWELVKVIREFRHQGLRELYRPLAQDEAELREWVRAESTPGPVVSIGPEPPDTVDSRARGRVHYRSLCASCHGIFGRGDAMPERVNAEDRPVSPRDLSHGVLKGGVQPLDLVTRIRCGMPGTPMPAVPPTTLDDSGVWDLVHYLRTLIPAGAQELHDPIGWTLRVPRVDGPLPAEAGDPRFAEASELHVALAPFRTLEPTIPGLLVRAIHDGEHVIFRIVYPDATYDVPGPDHRKPPDGFSVRVTSVPRPPVLPLPGQPLPLDRSLWLAGPMPPEDDALFDGFEPRFQNPDNVCKSPIGPEKVGTAAWRDGLWTLVMPVRPSRAGEITPGRPMYASFAAFDGSLARGPLPVAFTAWLELVFDP
jgi:mono/diheme cytochrome c family protein